MANAFSDQLYHQEAAKGRLLATRCTSCESTYIPPQEVCSSCHGRLSETVEVNGSGTLVAFTVITIPPKRLQEAGFGRDNPYCVGVVEIPDAGRVVARIEGLDLSSPEEIQVGRNVEVAEGDVVTFRVTD